MFRLQDDQIQAFVKSCADLGAATVRNEDVSRARLEQEALALIPGLVFSKKVLSAAVATGSRRLLRAVHACCPADDWARFLLRPEVVQIQTDICRSVAPEFIHDLVRIGLFMEAIQIGPKVMLYHDDANLMDFLLRETPASQDAIFRIALAALSGTGSIQIQALAGEVLAYLERVAVQKPSELRRFMRLACYADDHRLALLILSTGGDLSSLASSASDPVLSTWIARSSSTHGRLANTFGLRDRLSLLSRPKQDRISDIVRHADSSLKDLST